MQEPGPQDQWHFRAAEGWLELGNGAEALAELENIPPEFEKHPQVLCLRHQIHARAGHWEMAAEVAREVAILLPDDSFGWIHWAYALHELKRTQEAYEVVHAVVTKFPDESTLPYNLACYSCQLGKLKEAMAWLERAIRTDTEKEIRTMALKDPDLKPLWKEIREW